MEGNRNVSIPAWCDWELAGQVRPWYEQPFQFQHGAIGSDGLQSDIAQLQQVSIPAWCDWEV